MASTLFEEFRRKIRLSEPSPNASFVYRDSQDALHLMLISAAGKLASNTAAQAHYELHKPTPEKVAYHVHRMIMASSEADVGLVQEVIAAMWDQIGLLGRRDSAGYQKLVRLCGLMEPSTDLQFEYRRFLNELFTLPPSHRQGIGPQQFNAWIILLLPLDTMPSTIVRSIEAGWDYVQAFGTSGEPTHLSVFHHHTQSFFFCKKKTPPFFFVFFRNRLTIMDCLRIAAGCDQHQTSYLVQKKNAKNSWSRCWSLYGTRLIRTLLFDATLVRRPWMCAALRRGSLLWCRKDPIASKHSNPCAMPWITLYHETKKKKEMAFFLYPYRSKKKKYLRIQFYQNFTMGGGGLQAALFDDTKKKTLIFFILLSGNQPVLMSEDNRGGGW